MQPGRDRSCRGKVASGLAKYIRGKYLRLTMEPQLRIWIDSSKKKISCNLVTYSFKKSTSFKTR